MAKKKYEHSEASIQKWIKEGRGNGRGSSYKPWLTVRDCASRGRSHRIFGHKSQRTHHLLSDLELATFLLLEWHPDTEEIREQFPLRREETKSISKDAGIQHPRVHGVWQVMTSDFLVNTSGISHPKFAIQAKYTDDLQNPRTIEKLEIERRYWLMKSVPWKVITEQDIPSTVFQNINWLYPAQAGADNENDLIEKSAFYLNHFKKMPDRPMIEIAQALDTAYDLELGQSLLEIRTLLAKRCFLFNILAPYRELIGRDLRLGEISTITEVMHVSNQ